MAAISYPTHIQLADKQILKIYTIRHPKIPVCKNAKEMEWEEETNDLGRPNLFKNPYLIIIKYNWSLSALSEPFPLPLPVD
jgi:hypothetical protein